MQSWRCLLLSLVVPFCGGTSIERRTEDVDTSYFQYDLSSFSLRFEKCQYVKTFDEEMIEDYDTILATKHFVVFNICPSDECEKCDGVHGEYVADLYDYLASTVEFEQEAFETMCDNCNERCNDEGEYCSGCGKTCYQWANLEANGYVDASQYIECQQLDYETDDDNNDDDDAQNIYIGPKCGSEGKNITISLFSDENCWEPITDMEVADILGSKLSYHVLANVVSKEAGDKVCLSCKESDDDDNNQNDNDQADEDSVNEMCEDVYNIAAKCESPYGLDSGFVNVNNEDNEYENQVENEFMACTFINSLLWNSYTETGEINIYAAQDEVIREVTAVQATSITMMSLFFVSLLGYAVYLHKAINKEYPEVALSSQGDGQVA